MIARLFAVLLAAALALGLPTRAAAFGRFGHETIARIALANVTPRTRAAIRRLLAASAVLDTPGCPAKRLEDASVWPDCVRAIRLEDGTQPYAYSSPWHYQNVDICRPFDPAPACATGDCVSAQIERDVAMLRDRAMPPKQRVQALAFLIHFVGDLHMPLHAGDKGDRGGNDVKASYGDYASERLNLHSIWDGPLAERAITTGPSLVRRYSKAERAELAAGSVTDWAHESWDASRTVVYPSVLGDDPCVPTPDHVTLDNAEIDRLVPLMRGYVERAGLRLARLLDEALGG